MQASRISVPLLGFGALACAALFFVQGTARAAGTCAIDVRKPETLKLSGKLTYKIFPGPPNYEDVRKGDRPEPAYILELDKPACASGIAIGNEMPHDTVMFSTAHLLFDGNFALAKELRRFVGQHVRVDGSSGDEAITGHHHAPFLMDVKRVARD